MREWYLVLKSDCIEVKQQGNSQNVSIRMIFFICKHRTYIIMLHTHKLI